MTEDDDQGFGEKSELLLEAFDAESEALAGGKLEARNRLGQISNPGQSEGICVEIEKAFVVYIYFFRPTISLRIL